MFLLGRVISMENWMIAVFSCITMYIPWLFRVGCSADLYKCLVFCGITGWTCVVQIKHIIAGKTRLIGIYDHWFLSQKLDFAHALLSIFLGPCCVLGFNPANVLSFVAFAQMDFYMSQVHCFILSYMILVGSNQSNTNMHAISLLILLCGFSCIIGLRPIWGESWYRSF